ncbi:MAG TPA: heme-copper oxidase subunit III [Thermodesulfobacteriota bacterium]|nr:heme-copper oxidase subunit III [Thermodesulfobacteriota bacterium]
MANNKMLVGFFIASESIFFLMLILAYVNFHGSVTSGPTAVNSLNPVVTGIFSLFLFASSFTIWLAGKSLREKNHFMLKVWILATIALGAVFIFGQGLEWSGLIDKNITISRNVFGTTFFTLTGFHGFHVCVGLIMLSLLLGLALAGDFKGPKSDAVECISLYWHFVDGVWVVVFSVIYLWAFL